MAKYVYLANSKRNSAEYFFLFSLINKIFVYRSVKITNDKIDCSENHFCYFGLAWMSYGIRTYLSHM